MTWVGTDVLHTDDRRPLAVEAVIVGKSHTIVESAVSARSVKLRSAF